MKYLVLFFAASLLYLAGGCSSQFRSDEESDPVEQIYPLLDQRLYDEAIVRLNRLQRADQRPRVKIVLASAYAGRAGLEVRELWNMGLVARKIFGEEEFSPSTTRQRQMVATVAPLLRAIALLNQQSDISDPIPSVSQEQRDDILRARKVLEPLQTADVAAYRSVLGVVLFKSTYSRGPVSPFEIETALREALYSDLQDPNSKKVCTLPVESWRDWIFSLVNLSTSIFDDANRAWPSRAEIILDWRQAFVKIAEDLARSPSLPPECRP